MLVIQKLTEEAVRPFGWALGRARQTSGLSFSENTIDFWEEQLFDPGPGAQAQILWVNYRDCSKAITRLETHRLTQQIVVPLTGEIVQIVAQSRHDGSPNLASLSAFRVKAGEGICMRPGCWHATRVEKGEEVRCLMLTRRSTTVDLISHLQGASPLTESALADVNVELT